MGRAARHGDRKDAGTPGVSAPSPRRHLPIPQLVIAAGIIMCLMPVVTDLWFRWESSRNVTVLSDTANALDDAERERLLAQARAYNAHLGGYEDPSASIPAAELLPYGQQLSLDATETMGWLEVPRANLKVSVYHGIGEPALSVGVGHQPETSLPVGGARSHCYLTGHSGMRQHRIFDGIRVLERGDVFAIHVLGETFAYRVIGWEIVDPRGIDVSPRDGDRCTLVTCTTTPDEWNPKGRIGVNDKRLLVHGERCEYDPAEFKQSKPAVEAYVNENSRPAIVAGCILLALLLAMAVSRLLRSRDRRA